MGYWCVTYTTVTDPVIAVVGDIQHTWDAVRRGLRRELLGVARHGAGEGDDALVDFHTDLGVSHARIPAEFAQDLLMNVFIALPHHDPTSFTRARPLSPRALLAVSGQSAASPRRLGASRAMRDDPEMQKTCQQESTNVGSTLEWACPVRHKVSWTLWHVGAPSCTCLHRLGADASCQASNCWQVFCTQVGHVASSEARTCVIPYGAAGSSPGACRSMSGTHMVTYGSTSRRQGRDRHPSSAGLGPAGLRDRSTMDVITTHLQADCDGLAAMVAARKLYPGAALVFPGGAQETVRRFLAIYDVGLTRLKDLKLEEITRLILVDTQEPERLGPLQPLCMNPAVVIHIYDHHPAAVDASQGTCHADLKVVESVGATTTVLIERVLQQGLPLSPLEATTLALGLYDETGSFTYVSTTPRDLQAAAAVLRAGADLTVVADTLRQPLEPDTIALLNDLLQHSTTYYLEGSTVLLATSHQEHYHGELAEVVQRLAELKGLDAVIAAFAMDDNIAIIGRSRRPRIDVAQIAAAFGGGGHPGAAAATVKDRTMVEVRRP